ncbi:actin depolymerization factor/cofilin-like domain-containing protein [Kocuria palustris]|nr:actin depolymerization factor/cofilin-like domain-containing protein [Kocuria palustris]
MKLGKKHRYVIYKVSDDKTQIVVEEAGPLDDGTQADYEKFTEKLPENECKYAVYLFEYDIGKGEGSRSKLVFFTWTPDTAPVRSKMIYASSKDALKLALNGLSLDIQGTDFSEVSYETVLEKVSRGAGSH